MDGTLYKSPLGAPILGAASDLRNPVFEKNDSSKLASLCKIERLNFRQSSVLICFLSLLAGGRATQNAALSVFRHESNFAALLMSNWLSDS
jgi:hypothetical protein